MARLRGEGWTLRELARRGGRECGAPSTATELVILCEHGLYASSLRNESPMRTQAEEFDLLDRSIDSIRCNPHGERTCRDGADRVAEVSVDLPTHPSDK